VKTVSPTGSYAISLPDGIEEEYEGRVSSFWLDKSLLLQISSNKRVHGSQVSSHQRLTDRFTETCNASSVGMVLSGCPDVAASLAKEDDGLYWLYCYASWPDLMLFITIAGPLESEVLNGWAVRAVESIEKKSAT
jgi:hypothetical protein